jgi:predicted RNase H-like nuclease
VVVLVDGHFHFAFVTTSLQSVVATELKDVEVIGVDVPIGLPQLGERRQADQLAREYVGGRRSSVFFTPPEEMVRSPSHAEANSLVPNAGQKISSQAFALRRAILDVHEIALTDTRFYEVHPEVSFVCANHGQHLSWPKTSWNGFCQRNRILADQGLMLPEDLGPAGAANVSDVLDATIVAWTADRIARKQAVSLPRGPTRIGAIWL